MIALELQIDDNPVFVPERADNIGVIYGQEETTKPEDKVRSYKIKTSVVHLKYTYQGLDYEYYFRRGIWEKPDDKTVRFHAFEMLEV